MRSARGCELRCGGGRGAWDQRASPPRLSRFHREERGAVTAEFAIVLPMVIAVLGLVIGAITLAAQRITLVAVSAEVARAEARGDTAQAKERLATVGAGTQIGRRTLGSLHCVELSAAPLGGLLRAVSIRAESCAALTGSARLEAAA